MGFGPLRVINEDRVEGGGGFSPHPHRDMEIISYVLEGALEHRDSMGHGSVIRPGDVQIMSAGTGVVHSEYNHSQTERLHFLQIWIIPDEKGLEPGYAERHFSEEERSQGLRLLASGDAREGSLRIHQDVDLYGTLLSSGETLEHALPGGRKAWIQVARGRVDLDGHTLEAGDGAAVADEPKIRLTAQSDAELLVFDLSGDGPTA